MDSEKFSWRVKLRACRSVGRSVDTAQIAGPARHESDNEAKKTAFALAKKIASKHFFSSLPCEKDEEFLANCILRDVKIAVLRVNAP